MADENKISASQSVKSCCKFHWRGKVTVIVPLITLPILVFAYKKNAPAFRCLYLVVNMAIFWVTECIPLYLTAMLPVVFLPLFGILDSNAVCQLFFTDTLIMFLGGLFVALGVEYSNLHQRIALGTILVVGCSPRRLHFGLSMVSCFISFWISNSAATAMMCPIVKAILIEMDAQNAFQVYMTQEEERMEEGDPPHLSKVSMAFYFGVAYSSTIGGTGTLIGTGTNLTFKGLYETRFPNLKEKVDFPKFIMYSMPFVSILNVLLVFLTLQITHMGLWRPKSDVAKQVKRGSISKAATKLVLQERYSALGRWTCHEIQVGVVFVFMILLLFFQRPGFMKGWADVLNTKQIGGASPVLLTVIVMFALPTQYTFFRYCCKGPPFPGRSMDACLSWIFLHHNTPWGLCFLLGGGFALAEGSKVSGMAKMLGDSLSFITVMPTAVIIAFIIVVSLFCTCFSANVAICNILIPIFSEMAVTVKVHPLMLTLPAALAISMSYHLPVSTPPNAIICGYGYIKTKYLAVAGIFPTIWAFLIIFLNSISWAHVVYPTIKHFPAKQYLEK
ncbi:PREDICTED: protein I'm not dead yet 2-like [Drosophila arizonae]|uniref:Protein I'm not dead yet 2-like n=1 Tax=Drosophila arizonae TaxID=7263 RepID=A0ABM1NLJ1_DROAR|nr:PREDICTED: protein I'm not dead yet 2-like [Drosophila arizonae]